MSGKNNNAVIDKTRAIRGVPNLNVETWRMRRGMSIKNLLDICFVLEKIAKKDKHIFIKKCEATLKLLGLSKMKIKKRIKKKG